ncbi:hypothetical protein TNCV_1532521 [Trichonephila clavipes]|nr:hypothetical protein TNCV_1532521 [Trichonephila clavipes]
MPVIRRIGERTIPYSWRSCEVNWLDACRSASDMYWMKLSGRNSRVVMAGIVPVESWVRILVSLKDQRVDELM